MARMLSRFVAVAVVCMAAGVAGQAPCGMITPAKLDWKDECRDSVHSCEVSGMFCQASSSNERNCNKKPEQTCDGDCMWSSGTTHGYCTYHGLASAASLAGGILAAIIIGAIVCCLCVPIAICFFCGFACFAGGKAAAQNRQADVYVQQQPMAARV